MTILPEKERVEGLGHLECSVHDGRVYITAEPVVAWSARCRERIGGCCRACDDLTLEDGGRCRRIRINREIVGGC